jgi:hypothetical protein
MPVVFLPRKPMINIRWSGGMTLLATVSIVNIAYNYCIAILWISDPVTIALITPFCIRIGPEFSLHAGLQRKFTGSSVPVGNRHSIPNFSTIS